MQLADFADFLAAALAGEHGAALGVDAVILADPGLMDYAARVHPALRLHLSVQGPATNTDAIAIYQRHAGIVRAPIAGKRLRQAVTDAGQEDPDTLFFSRRLAMEGDTELGLLIKNTLDAIDGALFPRPRMRRSTC
jgi:hypothetical protein